MAGVKGKSGGRNRKASAQLEAEGGLRKARHANRSDISPAKGFPKKPAKLSKEQNRIWDAIVDQIADKALGTVDRDSLIELVETWELMVACRNRLKNDPVDKDTRIAWSAYFDRWLRLAQEFGCTPNARAALKVPAGDDDESDAFANILGRMSGVN